MKLTLLFIFFSCLVSCREITFREPQPKGIKVLESVPKSLVGRYPLPEDDGTVIDTLIIQSSGYYFAKDNDKGLLGNDLVLKKYKGYYFVNMNGNPEWFLRIIKQDKDGTITIMRMDNTESNFALLVKDLSKEIRVDTVMQGEDTFYQIDPSPKELMGLIKKGYFKAGPVLKKINE